MKLETSDKIFIILLILAIYVDLFSTKTIQCLKGKNSSDKLQIILVLILHHMLNIFANFGFLLNNKKLLTVYIISPLFMLWYWSVNKNKCDLTVAVNKMCGWNESDYFNDFFNILGFKKYKSWEEIWHKVFIAGGISIGIYKLFKK